jgi:hypothetical protein
MARGGLKKMEDGRADKKIENVQTKSACAIWQTRFARRQNSLDVRIYQRYTYVSFSNTSTNRPVF